MDDALEAEGLQPLKLRRKTSPVMVSALPGDDLLRIFHHQPIRRPWGFVYSGAIGLEIPALRAWLNEHRPSAVGVFHFWFTGYEIGNDDALRNFMVEHGDPIPLELWAGLIRERLERIPPSVAELIKAYRRNKEQLGWLAHPYDQPKWEFLLRWRENPDPSLHVPRMLANGQIV